MTATAVPLDNEGRIWLQDDALTQIGHRLTARILDVWVRDGAITPTQPATGKGSRVGWSTHDLAMLQAIARVRADIDDLGMQLPHRLVGELWDQLDTADTASIEAGTVTITVHLEAP